MTQAPQSIRHHWSLCPNHNTVCYNYFCFYLFICILIGSSNNVSTYSKLVEFLHKKWCNEPMTNELVAYEQTWYVMVWFSCPDIYLVLKLQISVWYCDLLMIKMWLKQELIWDGVVFLFQQNGVACPEVTVFVYRSMTFFVNDQHVTKMLTWDGMVFFLFSTEFIVLKLQ